MSKYVVFIFMLAITIRCHAQDLIHSRQSSYYTYIFRLTDKEAQKIYKKGVWRVDESYFHTVIDSFPTDSGFYKNLPDGNYLRAFSDKNRLKFEIASVHQFDIRILDNNTDLCIQVFDSTGKIISDASVKAGLKRLRFDRKTQTYTDRKSNYKGLLKVTHNGLIAYYDLSRRYNNPALKRIGSKIVYSIPAKYIWVPVNYVIRLPIDGVRSINRRYAIGSISRTERFFRKCFQSFVCLFDGYYCDDYNSAYKGYIVFNKPKYHPGDTVRFKAFILNKHGKPVNKPMKVLLQPNRKRLTLTTLHPYCKGGYEYSFYLHDSLELKLDRDYPVFLETKFGREYQQGHFTYEDYELSGVHLDLKMDETTVYLDNQCVLFARGTDENGLNILDGRLLVTVRAKDVEDYFGEHVFLPDTLTHFEVRLGSEEDTKIMIPDSIFPGANMTCSIEVKLMTSDNQLASCTQDINYYHCIRKIDYSVAFDSLEILYNKDGKNLPVNSRIYGVDMFGNRTMVLEGNLPAKLKINPYYSHYLIDADSLKRSISLSAESPLISCLSERTGDSIHLVVSNPRNLPFSYFIYRRNSEKERGYSDSVDYDHRISSKQNYFVSIHYLWAGKMRNETFKVPLNDRKLNISVTEPRLVFPSQKAIIGIKVTDIDGKPVAGVDLTASSFTRKFDFTTPALVSSGKNRKDKTVINKFQIRHSSEDDHSSLKLNYGEWKLLAGIDSIEYYKFLYPGNDIYESEYIPVDSITQFSPFIVTAGSIQTVHVIYVDNRPVYFSWSTNERPYSFPVSAGYHSIKMRTADHIFQIDSLYFDQGKKKIFSLSDSCLSRKVRVTNAVQKLSSSEMRVLYRYIFPYRNNFGERYAFVSQGNNVQFLKPENANIRNNLAGPFSGSRVNFNLVDSFSTSFVHEPFFQYEFSPGLLKMRSIDPKFEYPNYFLAYNAKEDLAQEIFTREKLLDSWTKYLDSKRISIPHYRYPRTTINGNGRLLISLLDDSCIQTTEPLNILLFKNDDPEYVRIFPGNIRTFENLEPAVYNLICFYPGSEYFKVDSLCISGNGINYYRFRIPAVLKNDKFSNRMNKIIEENIFRSDPYWNLEQYQNKTISNTYRQQFQYTGNGNIIEGYVYDENGEPLIGVTVLLKGTTFGAVTDMDGYYFLKIPEGGGILVFSYVGYESQEKETGESEIINANLVASELMLQEVIVIGYGTQKKNDLTGSVAIVETKGISGMDSDLARALQGKAAGVEIMQDSGKPGSGVTFSVRGAATTHFVKQPLYIIDGMVYSGDISRLDPSLIKNIKILQGEAATTVYGSQGANGVVVISTNGTFRPTASLASLGADYGEEFYTAASKSSSVRNNFSDYAFWQPKLRTDKNGEAHFSVTFPDDVTSWRTFYYAMNGRRQSGQAEGLIKSYKPLMAQLSVPQFMVSGDTVLALGKVLNYTPDSLTLKTSFEVNGQPVFSRDRLCIRSLIDTLPVNGAEGDSMSMKYVLEKPDGYYDGEKRTIPVFPTGMTESRGQFLVLNGDTTVTLEADSSMKDLHIHANADVLDICKDEISGVIHYLYNCNEQLASRLKALLSEQRIKTAMGVKFTNESLIKKMIRLLEKNESQKGMWGWWKDSEEPGLWISLHVLEALTDAKTMGYTINIDNNEIIGSLLWELGKQNTNISDKLRALKILKLLNSEIDYKSYIAEIENNRDLNLNQFLNLSELKQKCGLSSATEFLIRFRKETIFGNVYYEDTLSVSGLLNNTIQNTLIAYRILRSDSSANHEAQLQRIRNYFFEVRKDYGWRNTYESACILETILPDILNEKRELQNSSLTFSGSKIKTVNHFPFDTTISATGSLKVIKKGDYPVYLTSYQRFWNPSPREKKSDFEISTSFSKTDSISVMKAGEEVKLIVDLKVLKDADYVMLNIPIPAGCSYSDKKNYFHYEVHREYFKNETAIFCEKLKKGDYRFEIDLMPRYSGKYNLNPAKAELMYFPTFNANERMKKVIIQ